MNEIKNIHLLELSEKDREKIEAGALQYRKYSNIVFKVLEAGPKTITVRVSQGKHLSENYLDKKELAARAKEFFTKFFPDQTIHIRAFPYKPNPVTEIDSEWVRKQMNSLGVRVTDIVTDTGIGKANISGWANGLRPMSQPVKAMFFHYFKSLSRK